MLCNFSMFTEFDHDKCVGTKLEGHSPTPLGEQTTSLNFFSYTCQSVMLDYDISKVNIMLT